MLRQMMRVREMRGSDIIQQETWIPKLDDEDEL